MTDTRTTLVEGGRIVTLWTGLLLAPVAFLVNLELSYLMVSPSCARGSALSLHRIHGACLLLALAGAVVAWRSWGAVGTGWPGEAGGPAARSRFLAGLGFAGSAFFALAILAQWIPTLTLHLCQ
jgi:hypothetical protein